MFRDSERATSERMRKVEQLGSSLPAHVRRQMQLAMMPGASEFQQRRMDQYLEMASAAAAADPFHPSPGAAEFAGGEIVLPARVMVNGSYVQLPIINGLASNLTMIGAPGFGKSSALRSLVCAVLNAILCTVWIFRFKPSRDEYNVVERFSPPIHLLDGADLRLNPLEPVAMSADHARDLSTLNSFFWQTFQGNRALEARVLNGLFASHQTDSTGSVPTVEEEWNALSSMTIPRNDPAYQYRGRILARLEGEMDALGDIIRCRRGFPIAKLITTNLCIDVSRYGAYAEYIALLMIQQLISYVDLHGAPDQRCFVIALDDSQRIFSRATEAPGGPDRGIPLVSHWLMTCRSRGIFFVTSLHSTRLASRALLQDSGVKLMARMHDYNEIAEMGKSMGFRTRGQFEAAERLMPGQFVFKWPGHPTPFLVQFDPPEDAQ